MMENLTNTTLGEDPGGGTGNRSMVEIVLTNSESSCGVGNGSATCRHGLSISTPILMMSSGLIGNALALVVLYTSKKEFKKTPFYTLMMGLAWTDLIGQLLVSPTAIIVYGNNFQWVGGQPTCVYHAFCMVCFGMLTPVLVCTMSIDRLVALKFSFYYARSFTKRKAQLTIVGCWACALLFCSLPLAGFGSYELQFPKSWCFLNFHRESDLDVAYATTFSVLSLMFILTNIACNIVVVGQLIVMRRKRILSHSPSLERRHGTNKAQKTRLESETQMVVFLCAITLVFSTCYLPFNVNILLNQITGVTNRAMDLLGVRMVGINQILDPWLYILLRRTTLVKILKLVRDKIRNTSRSLVQFRFSHSRDQTTNQKQQNISGGKTNTNYHNGKHKDGSTSNLLPDKPEVAKPPFQRSFSADNEPSSSCTKFTSLDTDDNFNEEMCLQSNAIPLTYKRKLFARRLSWGSDSSSGMNHFQIQSSTLSDMELPKYCETITSI